MSLTQQPRGQPSTEQMTAQSWPGLTHQHQTRAALGRMLDQGFRHLAGAQQHHFATEAFGELLSTLQTQT